MYILTGQLNLEASLTEYFPILELQNLPIDEHYLALKRGPTNFEALKLLNVRSLAAGKDPTRTLLLL